MNNKLARKIRSRKSNVLGNEPDLRAYSNTEPEAGSVGEKGLSIGKVFEALKGRAANLSTIDRWVIAIFIFGLVLRFLLINLNTAEYSDAIYYMDPEYDYGRTSPLYPFSIRVLNFIFNDVEFTAKLISILAASLSVFPLYLIGKQTYNEKAGLYAVLLYSVSPLALQWSLRVKTEALYGLFFLLAVWLAILFFRSRQLSDLIWFTFIAGLFMLAKVYGILLIPVLIFLYLLYIRDNGLKKLVLSPVWVGAIPWVLVLVWLVQDNFAVPFYSETTFEVPEPGFVALCYFLATNLVFNIEAFVSIATVPVLLCVCFGIYQSLHASGEKTGMYRFWLGLFFFLLVASFAVWSTYTVWGRLTTRHYYGIMPLFFVLAGYGIYAIGYHVRQRWLLAALLIVCIITNSVYSAVGLYYQRDAFGDVKRAAIYAGTELGGETVFCDEEPKTAFWANIPVQIYSQGNEGLQPGAYVILHSAYSDINEELSYLSARFNMEIVYETTSSIKPLMSPLLTNIEDANSPEWFLQRFKTQFFWTVIVKLSDKSEQA